jgi:hypothetical protein
MACFTRITDKAQRLSALIRSQATGCALAVVSPGVAGYIVISK